MPRRLLARLEPLIWISLLTLLILGHRRSQPPAAHDLKVQLLACRSVLRDCQAQHEAFHFGWLWIVGGLGIGLGYGLGRLGKH